MKSDVFALPYGEWRIEFLKNLNTVSPELEMAESYEYYFHDNFYGRGIIYYPNLICRYAPFPRNSS